MVFGPLPSWSKRDQMLNGYGGFKQTRRAKIQANGSTPFASEKVCRI
jgi:hypothetical protein